MQNLNLENPMFIKNAMEHKDYFWHTYDITVHNEF